MVESSQAGHAAHTPAALGYRWPAEWEPHTATWLAWPHNRETWPGRLDGAIRAIVAIVRALHTGEAVCINVGDVAMEEDARRRLREGGVDVDAGVRFYRIPTNDAWARDHGPVFLIRDVGGTRTHAVVDFRFDCWGRKYEPWDLDDAVPRRVADALAVPRFEAGFVLEGGSVDGNGRGAVLTTESCLLNSNRGPGRSRPSMERALRDFLGARCVLWLGGGIVGGDTDGHVDDVARFVDASTVVAAVEEDAADPNAVPLTANLHRLRALRDQDGKPLAVATLPMPPPLILDGVRLPASYANFYLGNAVTLVPTFGHPSDERALAVLGELLPTRTAVGIPCADLASGLGALHCVTQPQPA